MVMGGVKFCHAPTVPLPLAGGRGISCTTLGHAPVPTRVPLTCLPRHVRVVTVSQRITWMIPVSAVVVVVVGAVVVMVIVVVVV